MNKINPRFVMAVLWHVGRARERSEEIKPERWATRWALRMGRLQVRW
jgi:hypothetical protein